MVRAIDENIRIKLLLVYFYGFGYLRFQLHRVCYNQVCPRISIAHQDMIVAGIANAQTTLTIGKVSLSHDNDIQFAL